VDGRLLMHHVLGRLNGRCTGICVHSHVVRVLMAHLLDRFSALETLLNGDSALTNSPHSLAHACDGPFAFAGYSCDCDGPFVRVAASHCRPPCRGHCCRQPLAAYNSCRRSVAAAAAVVAAAEVAVGEVSCHFVVALAAASLVDPSHSPLDWRGCLDVSNPLVPCSDCSSPCDRMADSAGRAAYWPDCDASVCSDAFVRPCRRQSGSDRACRCSCRNL